MSIDALKRQLIGEYEHMRNIAPDYGCGHEMAKHINVSYSLACAAVNATLDKLALLDPATPKIRY